MTTAVIEKPAKLAMNGVDVPNLLATIGAVAAQPELADREVVLEVANPGYTASISTFELAQVIKPRLMEIFDLVKRDVEQSMGALELSAGNVVLTGGASLMPGVEQLAADRFRLPVRTGATHGVSGLTDVVSGPSHATAVGLVRYGMLHQREHATPARGRTSGGDGPVVLKRIRDILKDFF